MTIRGMAFSLMALLGLACGSPTGPELASFTGHWEGSEQGDFEEGGTGVTSTFSGTLSFDLVQATDGTVSGTGLESNRICGGKPCSAASEIALTLTGTVSGKTVQLSAPYCRSTASGPRNQPITFYGTATTASTINGPMTICTGAHATGTFTLTRR